MVSRRQAQMISQLQRQVAEAIAPIKTKSLVTVTRANISPDSKQASVWLAGWDLLSAKEQSELRRAAVVKVTRASQTKFTPHLELINDDAGIYAQHINELLADS